ncbi:zf-HC2 domain-containing protein [Streptomyces sp. NBC_00237]|uniref:anti-sigma factor family protein n=1 Tax=Streptomyces sp. NBC_00237 TaxID=2975687 RepID=UPI00224EAFE1|nr:zf-HC2 domain-containing protein [Streptomyces sp. NBC_00237]MCX5200885.1 zf-HC2 domain-containing protein [Streptomyces sp. NBC_00237]
MSAQDSESVHDAVAAYSLGILDESEATAFEAHLAGCDYCAAQLDDFAGLAPMLAALAEPPGPPRELTPPSTTLLTNLVDEVAVRREQQARRRRRGLYLVAAAAAVVIGGSGAVVVAAANNDSAPPAALPDPHPTSPAEDAFFHHMEKKTQATDPTTKVTAVVGTEKKGWGTHTVLELKNVKGPLKCSLIAVSKDGEEEVVSSWSVPKWGYGIPDSPHKAAKNPLYVHGGAAMDVNDIDHFEVRTFDGTALVKVDA